MSKRNKTEMILCANSDDRLISASKLLSSSENGGLRDYIGKITVGNIVVMDEHVCSVLVSPLPNRINVVITTNDGFNRDGFVRAKSMRDFMYMLATKFDEYRDVYVITDDTRIMKSFIGYADRFKIVKDNESKIHDKYEKYGSDGIRNSIVVDIRRSTNIVGEHRISESMTVTDHEIRDNVFMFTADSLGLGTGCYPICAREPIVHVNHVGQSVRRKSKSEDSIVLHRGDRVMMRTGIEVYRCPKNVHVDIKSILYNFVYDGISVESSRISDDGLCVGIINMGSKPVFIRKNQAIAIMAIRGEHEPFIVPRREFPDEHVGGWNNYEND